MQYAVLIYTGEGDAPTDEAAAEAVTAEYMALSAEPITIGGAELHPPTTATTVRQRDGETLITDGPFAETKEVFGGFYLLEAADLDQALDFAARIPAVRFGGSVEVRPIVER